MTLSVVPAHPPAAQPPIEHSAPGRIRVCHLSTTLQTGGLERLLVDYARFTDPARFELSFVALEALGQPADDLCQLGFDVQSLELSRTGKRHAIRRLRDILRSRHVDVLHTHNTLPGFYGAVAKLWAGVPVMLNTQHGRGCGVNWKAVTQFTLANIVADRVLGVSEDSACLCRYQDRWHAKKIDCIWNGIDVERFAYRGPANVPVAICVGRLSPEKDLATLLHATALVVWNHPEFRLRIVGDGRERGSLERLSRELNIGGNVEFLGERADVPELLSGSAFFVSSSITEGISLTLLEAMSVGLPVVTTAVGGTPEIVVDGMTGRLVPPQDPERLAQAITDMLCERNLWCGMGEAGRQRVEHQFDIRVGIARYQSLYEELLMKNSRHR